LNPSNFRKLSLPLPANELVDLSVNLGLTETHSKFSNIESSSKFKELKSGNMNFLSPDRNTRLIDKLQSNKGQLNFSNESSNLNDVVNKITISGSSVSENEIYNSASND
jgi:hypothetical protein